MAGSSDVVAHVDTLTDIELAPRARTRSVTVSSLRGRRAEAERQERERVERVNCSLFINQLKITTDKCEK